MITLLTDFGLEDGYAGVMKGVIWNITPDVQIADITHLVPPQDILAGALAIKRAYRYFPAGTIHIGVVDPGVGTMRRGMAAKIGRHYFVGPDNGLFSLVMEQAQWDREEIQLVELNRPSSGCPISSSVFHGRDIFAPAGAHLAAGTPLEKLGDLLADPIRLDIPAPEALDFGWRGEVIHIDHFGNLATNLTGNHLAGMGPVTPGNCRAFYPGDIEYLWRQASRRLGRADR